MASRKVSRTVLALFLLISSFALLGASTRLSSTNEKQDLVSRACSFTLYVDVCMSSLRSDPQSETSDLRGLANIALNQSIAHGFGTLSHIENLKSNDGNGSQFTSRCLSDCIQEYSDAIQSMQEAIHALRIRSFDTVNSLVTSAMTDSDTCENGFNEIENESPLAERNQFFNKLCSNFLAITKLLF